MFYARQPRVITTRIEELVKEGRITGEDVHDLDAYADALGVDRSRWDTAWTVRRQVGLEETAHVTHAVCRPSSAFDSVTVAKTSMGYRVVWQCMRADVTQVMLDGPDPCAILRWLRAAWEVTQ